MPTKKELEKQVRKLQNENSCLFNKWSQAKETNSELLDKLVIQTILMRAGDEPSTWDSVDVPDIYKIVTDIIKKGMQKEQQKVDAVNALMDRKDEGYKKRTENSSKKYHAMLPFYIEGLRKGQSFTQAARNAHRKAREIDNTVPESMSDRHLTRKLNELYKDTPNMLAIMSVRNPI